MRIAILMLITYIVGNAQNLFEGDHLTCEVESHVRKIQFYDGYISGSYDSGELGVGDGI